MALGSGNGGSGGVTPQTSHHFPAPTGVADRSRLGTFGKLLAFLKYFPLSSLHLLTKRGFDRMSKRIKDFVDKNLYKIRGFMHPVDAMTFAGLMEFQDRNNISGSIAEIGVFYGRSLSLLGQYIKDGETAVGLDLYDIRGQLAYVEDVVERIGFKDRCALQAVDSLTLKADELISRFGKFRFFSVDGGHEHHHVMNDGMLAMDTLTDDGVIAFDDFMNPQYPDVSVAVIDLLRQRSDQFVPFCITNAKLYVTNRQSLDLYKNALSGEDLWARSYTDRFPLLGSEVLYVTQSLGNRAIYQKLAERGLGALGDRLTSRKQREFSRQ